MDEMLLQETRIDLSQDWLQMTYGIEDPWIRGAMALVLGLCIGSFLNVVALRSLARTAYMVQDLVESLSPETVQILGSKSWLSPWSQCINCHHRIGPLDNIPVVSYMMLGGKCRHCKEPIHWQYPVVEIFTGIMFVAILHYFGWSIQGLAMLIFVSTLIAVTITDFRDHLIPHEITYPSILLGLIYSTFFRKEPLETMAGIGVAYIVFDFIQFYGLLFVQGFLSREEEEDEKVEEENKEPEDKHKKYMEKLKERRKESQAKAAQETGAQQENEEKRSEQEQKEQEATEDTKKDDGKELAPAATDSSIKKSDSSSADECDAIIDLNFDMTDPDDGRSADDYVVMGGGDAVLAAVVAAWLGWKGMAIAILLAFLIGSVMGAVYLFVDMKNRGILHETVKPATIGFLLGFGILCIPLFMLNSLSPDASWWNPQLLAFATAGGFAGGTLGATWAGSKFRKRFPFGPAIAVGAMVALFVTCGGQPGWKFESLYESIPWGSMR
jgi:Type II secretory pathway, prepilin signal peptidase PulO and related peptidases